MPPTLRYSEKAGSLIPELIRFKEKNTIIPEIEVIASLPVLEVDRSLPVKYRLVSLPSDCSK